MKILNLYAGVGGNRQLWGDKHEITAVELNPSVAACYNDLYPNDTVIITDAHYYLLDNYKNFDFIWASPPCQSHSRCRFAVAGSKRPNPKQLPIYPDMKLYQEIIFLKHYFKGNWLIENVIPFYKPLVEPSFTIGGHHYWSNKFIFDTGANRFRCHNGDNQQLSAFKNIDITKYKFVGIDKRAVLRNMVEPDVGLYIFEQLNIELNKK